MFAKMLATLAVVFLLNHPSAAADISPAPPAIPDHTFNFADFGANGDSKTYNTDAFTKAVAAVQAAGGGRLNIPAGVYLTMPFSLTSHMDLHLDHGAVIQFPAELAAYGLPAAMADATDAEMTDLKGKYSALLAGSGLTDISITGAGVIDGGGKAWWPLTSKDRPGKPHTSYGNFRPKLVVLTNCQRLAVQGVTLRNSPMYELVPKECTDVLIEGVHINAPAKAPNTDAIDPMASQNVVIRDCDLDVGDDNVAVKAIQGPCSDILIENCRCKHGHGISIGSETYKGIHDVTVRDCTFDGGDNGIRIKSARDRGNDLYNFTFSNITMKNMGTALTINMYYQDKAGAAERASHAVTPSTPLLHDVRIDNLTVSSALNAGDIVGLPESLVKNITLSHVKISANKGLVVHDAQGIEFDDVSIDAKTGQPLMVDHADVKIN